MAVASPRPSPIRAPLSGACPSPNQTRPATHDAIPYPLPIPTGRASSPRFDADALFYLAREGNRRRLVESRPLRACHANLARASKARSVEPVGRLGGWISVSHSSFDMADVAHCGSRRTTAADRHALAAGIDIQGAAGQSAVDWSPDGQVDRRRRRAIRAVRRLFKIPARWWRAHRLIDGPWVNPIWSPKDDDDRLRRPVVDRPGDTCARSGRMAPPMSLPNVMVRPGGYRFLPDGSGLVLPAQHPRAGILATRPRVRPIGDGRAVEESRCAPHVRRYT